MNMKQLKLTFLFAAFCLTLTLGGQTYRHISGWSQEINDRIEDYLNSTLTMNVRKVAVFDSDGTTFGQVPHYLADEALYRYADVVLKERKDKELTLSVPESSDPRLQIENRKPAK